MESDDIPQGRRPTIDDVAARSGVARTTVSRVVNNGPNVSARMRSRVLAAVEELGYQINQQAQLLARGAHRTVLLIGAVDVGAEPNSYYLSALEIGALRVAVQVGVEVVAHRLTHEATTGASRVIETVERSGCLGVILTPPFSDDAALIDRLADDRRALVCISPGAATGERASCVSMDDEAAGHAMAAYLLQLGHRRFGFVKGRAEHVSAEHRFGGALRALREAGLSGDAMVAVRGDFTFRGGRDALPELLSGEAPPTAIICANDDTAVGALFAAHRDGLTVPGDLSIGSFDDTPVSALVWPPLTTVRQPIQEMGSWAVQTIAASPAGGLAVQHQILPFELIVRGSAAPPRLG